MSECHVEWFHAVRASFTKQGKLARERNSKTAPIGGEISAGDLLTMRKLKNTDAPSHLHIDQRNIPSAAQISIVANKEIKKPQYIEKNRRPKNETLLDVLIGLVSCNS